MTRTIASLLFLLGVQLVLTSVLYWPEPDSQSASGPLVMRAALLGLDRIEISDEAGNRVSLHKQQGHWRLPDLAGLPADPEQVDALLSVLSQRSPGFPVATTIAARQRFQVTSYLHRRSIKLLAHEALLAEIYLGRSPGYRQVYTRRADREAIYSLDYAGHNTPATASAWLDPALLQLGPPDAIRIGELQLTRLKEQQWRSTSGATPEPRELAALLELLRHLRVRGLADQDLQRSLASDGRALRTLELRSGTRTLSLRLFARDGAAFILDSRYPVFFELGERQARRLLTLDLERLAGDDGEASDSDPSEVTP